MTIIGFCVRLFQLRLRLGFLLLTLICTVLAWLSYRARVVRFDELVHQSSVRHRLDVAAADIQSLTVSLDKYYQQDDEVAAGNESPVVAFQRKRIRSELARLEADRAIAELELDGFGINRDSIWPEVIINRRSLSEDDARKIIRCIQTISHHYRIVNLKLNGSSINDHLLRDLKAACPSCNVNL